MSDAATGTHQPTDERNDVDLVARWKAGDQRAAALLVERHKDTLARFVSSLADRHEVEDVVQETFIRAFEAIDDFRGYSSLRPWLLTIARRLVLDHRRAGRRRVEEVEMLDADMRTEFDALDAMVADETEKRMRAAVERLTPTQREVFVLRVTEGMSYKEIADCVGSTEGSARVHYHNAMRAIKELLDE